MRIDKFLWCVRKFKTRSLATDMVRKERVLINDELAKPSRTVKVGDSLTVKKEGISYSFTILDIPKSRLGAKLVESYIKDTTPPEETEKAEVIRMMKTFNRRKGTGRPTKKDRRDIDRLRED
ncbi:MAG: RNA-binding S4 domain-containing protein [Owenweeksia sp.]